MMTTMKCGSSITCVAAARVQRKYRILQQAKIGANVHERNISLSKCQANMYREKKRNVSLNPAILSRVRSALTHDSFKYSRRDCLVCDIPIYRLVPNRENVTLVWFDSMLTGTNTDASTFIHLRALNDYVLFYTQKSMLLEYLMSKTKKSDHVIVVLYDIEILDKAHECEEVRAILIVDSNNTMNKSMITTDHHPKLVGIFEERGSMLVKLQQVIVDVEHHVAQEVGNTFSTFNRKERALRDVRHELACFLWSHVFKVMIKYMPHSLDARQQMLDECRKYYNGNPRQLAIIDEFERTYCATDAIRWYTRPCFLFRLVNKALRTEDIAALYIFRYFITDLCASLEATHHKQIPTCVYRGAVLSRDEVEKYHVGNLLAANEFLSSSRDLHVAHTFIGLDPITGMSPSQNRQDQLQFVLFRIDIDPSLLPDIIVADVTDQSFFPDENEILFALGTTFEIVTINYDYEHYLWRIEMRPSTEIIHLNREYEHYICERINETNATLLFGILLADMGEYAQSFNYFERLLARMPQDHEDRPNAYYSLARVYRFIGQRYKALTFFRRAEHLQRAKLPESKFDLARTLAGIGSVYCWLHDYRRELFYYKRAMRIYRQILPRDHIEIARSLYRLGLGYAHQQQYTRALRYLTQSLSVYNKTVPDAHPDKAETLHNMGLVHYQLGHVDQTLDFYQKALKMRETALPEDHPDIAETCYLLSVYYEEQQQHNVALEYAHRALRIYEKKLPHGHELLRRVKDVVERLQNEPVH